MEASARAVHLLHQEAAQEDVLRRMTCFLVDIEGKEHAVPKVWRGTCRAEVERKMLHVKWWVPFYVQKVIEVEVKA